MYAKLTSGTIKRFKKIENNGKLLNSAEVIGKIPSCAANDTAASDEIFSDKKQQNTFLILPYKSNMPSTAQKLKIKPASKSISGEMKRSIIAASEKDD